MILPEYDLAKTAVNGRIVYEGYQRGNGLMFGDLIGQILAEEDYQEAFSLADGRTVVWQPRLMNLYLLIRFFLPRLNGGHIIEFGSFRGGSAFFMAKLAQKYLPGTQVYALDTFGGMPPTDHAIDLHIEGNFSETSYEEVLAAANAAGLDNLKLVKGLFQQTTSDVVATCGTVSLAHIDCDIYDAAVYCFETVKEAMGPGGYIVFDDATEASCIGATQAVEELIAKYNLRSEQIAPHFVFRWPPLAA
jgi:predicted O-methyltransferase YrrM